MKIVIMQQFSALLSICRSALFFLLAAYFPLSAQTAIGGNTPDVSAMLDVQSTEKGVLFPRVANPAAITSPATGLMIFNTGSRCLQINVGLPTAPSWQNVKCTTCGAFVAPGVWKEFMCHNLGADTNADPLTPSWKLNGDYYKWGNNTVAAPGPSDDSTPNDASIATWGSITSGADGAWADAPNPKVVPTDPCPAGFRVPSKVQWEGVLANNTTSNPDGGLWTTEINKYSSGKFFGSSLFLPAAGRRRSSTGSLDDRDDRGIYWSSTVSLAGSTSWYMRINSNEGGDIFSGDRQFGYSVRCIEDDTP